MPGTDGKSISAEERKKLERDSYQPNYQRFASELEGLKMRVEGKKWLSTCACAHSCCRDRRNRRRSVFIERA